MYFFNYLKNFDIALLQETWSQTQLYVEGFKSYYLPIFKANLKGRPQVGLSSFVSLHLNSE